MAWGQCNMRESEGAVVRTGQVQGQAIGWHYIADLLGTVRLTLAAYWDRCPSLPPAHL